MLTLFGGVIGVVVGVIGAQFTIVGVQPVIAPYSVVLAFGVAIAVGLVFGIYPANRARCCARSTPSAYRVRTP